MKEINNDKETNKPEVKEYSFAKYISELREKRNLTQKALAEKIQVSDRTISKWENGFTVPDLHNIRAICKELGVSANAVVLEKKSLSDYIRNFFGFLKVLSKHIFNNIFKLVFLIIFILLLIYFINNYNVISIYVLNYDSEDIKIGNGYFIRSKVDNILLIDNISISNYSNTNELTLELYTLVNGDKITLYKSNTIDDIFLEELTGYPDALHNDVVNGIVKGLYLDITTYDESSNPSIHSCLINFRKSFSNNKLIYSNYQVNREYKNDYQKYLNTENIVESMSYENFNHTLNNSYNNLITEASANTDEEIVENNNDNKLESLGYDYINMSGTYTKIDGNKTITYSEKMNLLISQENIDGIEYSMYYYITKDRIDYQAYDSNKNSIVRFKYLVSTKDLNCSIGNCENYLSDIEYILKEYQAISSIL